ncbi:nuclear transport factor 2 family protein [Cryobacterium tagatosivorans]|uniref:Nuclear transport factor 2 family protein n=1 Tax=Cryobacterium tagatosivorans TaxID=1259199 RepID=A0A4R8UD34_9MICO|nr:nuclear transport factor 2 family protein [Cryobacterium tagatosivorans]TFB47276.1 nuclear transport factor 2 family protein [Cryobacterium tagatosivorans]
MRIIIDQLLAAVNDHDLNRMVALFHPDYRSSQPAHPARAFVGRSQVHANWAAMFAGIADFRAELGRSTQDGDTTWCEWAWFGMRTDKQPFEVHGVALFQVQENLIVAGTLYMEDVESEAIGIDQTVQHLAGSRPVTETEADEKDGA